MTTNSEIVKLLIEAIANAMMNQDLPRIEYFSGSCNEDVTEWIANYETQAKLRKWDNELRLRKVGAYLKNTASDWHRYCVENLKNPIVDWDIFVELMKKTFLSDDASSCIKKKLKDRKQGLNEAVSNYILEKKILCMKLDSNMSDEEVIEYMYQGMQPEMCKMLHAFEYKNFEEFLDKAKKIENGIKASLVGHFNAVSYDNEVEIANQLKIKTTNEINFLKAIDNLENKLLSKIDKKMSEVLLYHNINQNAVQNNYQRSDNYFRNNRRDTEYCHGLENLNLKIQNLDIEVKHQFNIIALNQDNIQKILFSDQDHESRNKIETNLGKDSFKYENTTIEEMKNELIYNGIKSVKVKSIDEYKKFMPNFDLEKDSMNALRNKNENNCLKIEKFIKCDKNRKINKIANCFHENSNESECNKYNSGNPNRVEFLRSKIVMNDMRNKEENNTERNCILDNPLLSTTYLAHDFEEQNDKINHSDFVSKDESESIKINELVRENDKNEFKEAIKIEYENCNEKINDNCNDVLELQNKKFINELINNQVFKYEEPIKFNDILKNEITNEFKSTDLSYSDNLEKYNEAKSDILRPDKYYPAIKNQMNRELLRQRIDKCSKHLKDVKNIKDAINLADANYCTNTKCHSYVIVILLIFIISIIATVAVQGMNRIIERKISIRIIMGIINEILNYFLFSKGKLKQDRKGNKQLNVRGLNTLYNPNNLSSIIVKIILSELAIKKMGIKWKMKY
jgi:hypothetical protein